MITNKYESPPNYQQLKQQRLRQIQEDYFPSPPKNNRLFSPTPPRYVPTALYQPDYDDTFDPQSAFQVRISVKMYTVTLFIFIAAFFFVPIPQADGFFDSGGLIFMLLFLGGAGHAAVKIHDRRIYLNIHQHGLYFYNSHLYIPWEQVIATHFYLADNDDNDIFQLVTDYVDAVSGTCKTEVFNLKEYDKSLGEIALAITWYQQQFMESQKITNLPIQTI